MMSRNQREEERMSNEQQTAVELLWEIAYNRELTFEDWKQAKEMEKQRIETAYNKGTVHGIDYPESTLPLTGEQYYKETYENEQ
jgi:hypothetical protein